MKYPRGLYVKVTEAQLEALKRRAKKLGISASEVIRMMIMLK